MPIYEYQCVACGHVFELWQDFSDPVPEGCPECGGKIKKIIHAPRVVFKGTGFYSNDHKKTADRPKDKVKKEHTGHTEKKEDTAPVKKDSVSSKKTDEKKS